MYHFEICSVSYTTLWKLSHKIFNGICLNMLRKRHGTSYLHEETVFFFFASLQYDNMSQRYIRRIPFAYNVGIFRCRKSGLLLCKNNKYWCGETGQKKEKKKKHTNTEVELQCEYDSSPSGWNMCISRNYFMEKKSYLRY